MYSNYFIINKLKPVHQENMMTVWGTASLVFHRVLLVKIVQYFVLRAKEPCSYMKMSVLITVLQDSSRILQEQWPPVHNVKTLARRVQRVPIVLPV